MDIFLRFLSSALAFWAEVRLSASARLSTAMARKTLSRISEVILLRSLGLWMKKKTLGPESHPAQRLAGLNPTALVGLSEGLLPELHTGWHGPEDTDEHPQGGLAAWGYPRWALSAPHFPSMTDPSFHTGLSGEPVRHCPRESRLAPMSSRNTGSLPPQPPTHNTYQMPCTDLRTPGACWLSLPQPPHPSICLSHSPPASSLLPPCLPPKPSDQAAYQPHGPAAKPCPSSCLLQAHQPL